MNLTAEGIVMRDGTVFRSARDRKIPILMVLSGGYTRTSAGVIGRSIGNILVHMIGVGF